MKNPNRMTMDERLEAIDLLTATEDMSLEETGAVLKHLYKISRGLGTRRLNLVKEMTVEGWTHSNIGHALGIGRSRVSQLVASISTD